MLKVFADRTVSAEVFCWDLVACNQGGFSVSEYSKYSDCPYCRRSETFLPFFDSFQKFYKTCRRTVYVVSRRQVFVL